MDKRVWCNRKHGTTLLNSEVVDKFSARASLTIMSALMQIILQCRNILHDQMYSYYLLLIHNLTLCLCSFMQRKNLLRLFTLILPNAWVWVDFFIGSKHGCALSTRWHIFVTLIYNIWPWDEKYPWFTCDLWSPEVDAMVLCSPL